MKKNKFLTLLLAICMILPTMFVVTACGKSSHTHTYGEWSSDATNHWHTCSGCNETEKSEHTYVDKHDDTQYWKECSVCGKLLGDKVTGTVTEDEWKSALNFENVTNFHFINYANYTVREIKANETAASSVITGVSDGSLRSQYFYAVEGGDVYLYTYNKDNVSDLSKDVWTKTKKSTSADELFSLVNPKDNLSTAIKAKASFDYDAETGTYVSKADATGLKYSSTNLLSLKLKFANAKLVWLEYTLDMNNVQPEHCDISYDEVDIELPNLSAVTADEWSKALSFNSLTNYTINLNLANKTEKISVDTTKVKYETTTGSQTTTSIFDIEGKQRFDKSSTDTKYTKTAFNTTNLSTLLASSEAGKSTAYVSSLVNAFDSFEYKTDEKVYYIAQATINGADATDVKLTFDNRRLTKLEYTTTVGGSAQTNTLTYTYNDTTVTLPTASETVTKVSYNTTENKFIYEGVALTKGENVFEIEISDETHASYSIGGSYIVSGTFNTTSDTTSKVNMITAKNASGTDITNLNQSGSSNWYGMVFKDLSAGKYYITLNATEDCTGDFKLGFTTNSIKEKAITTQYSATTGRFSLNNVTLSTTEQWFVIDITEDHFDANSESGKCEILGEFTTSGSETLTISLEDESGTALSNLASDSNKFDFEISTYGKYYIKVTASEDCTSSLDIGFVDLTPGVSKKTAIAVPYSATDSKFILNNISLSTAEQWFVFEITDEQYSANKGKVVGCKVGGTVTLSDESDATLTISAEAENGTELTNSSTTGGMTYENLGAGKYYVKISATKDCTGSISLSFLKIISA